MSTKQAHQELVKLREQLNEEMVTEFTKKFNILLKKSSKMLKKRINDSDTTDENKQRLFTNAVSVMLLDFAETLFEDEETYDASHFIGSSLASEGCFICDEPDENAEEQTEDSFYVNEFE
jgi:hypothetical protein